MSAPAELLAAGWPLSVLLAAALIGGRVRERRIRVRAGEALHELRRPLQAMVLAPEADALAHQLDLVLPALSDLEQALRGGSPESRPRPLELRPLVEAAVGRWRHGSPEPAEAVELRWAAGDARAVGDPRRLAQALDNLIANALEHGGSPVKVEAARCASGLRLSVRNRVGPQDRSGGERGAGGDRWRSQSGHGLRIVSAIAADHGGRFLFDCSDGWALGILEIPLAGRALAPAIAG